MPGAPQATLLMLGDSDPYISNVVNLSHFDGTDGQTGALTNSVPRGNSITTTASGGELDTAIVKFGSASLLRISASPSTTAAVTTTHTDYGMGTGDWTVEFWFYIPTLATVNLWTLDSNSVDGSVYITNLGSVRYFTTADRITGANGSISAATWTAIAVSKVSGTTRLFVNGTQVGSNYTDGNDYGSTAVLRFAAGNANPNSGQWDEFRLTNGIGRYSANYTPATAPFPNR